MAEDFLSRLASESNHAFDIGNCVVPLLEYATFGNIVAHTRTHILGTAGTTDCSAARIEQKNRECS